MLRSQSKNQLFLRVLISIYAVRISKSGSLSSMSLYWCLPFYKQRLHLRCQFPWRTLLIKWSVWGVFYKIFCISIGLFKNIHPISILIAVSATGADRHFWYWNGVYHSEELCAQENMDFACRLSHDRRNYFNPEKWSCFRS